MNLTNNFFLRFKIHRFKTLGKNVKIYNRCTKATKDLFSWHKFLWHFFFQDNIFSFFNLSAVEKDIPLIFKRSFWKMGKHCQLGNSLSCIGIQKILFMCSLPLSALDLYRQQLGRRKIMLKKLWGLICILQHALCWFLPCVYITILF